MLGLYLGDGHISQIGQTYRLRVFLSERQADVIWRCVAAIVGLNPNGRVTVLNMRRMAIIHSFWRDWPRAFPQHGPGRKHLRRIALQGRQIEIIEAHADWFLRGLIESDGCRHRRIVRGKNYPAYGFKNRSEDILGLFVAACDRLGIRCKRSSKVQLSIARRPDVDWVDGMMRRDSWDSRSGA